MSGSQRLHSATLFRQFCNFATNGASSSWSVSNTAGAVTTIPVGLKVTSTVLTQLHHGASSSCLGNLLHAAAGALRNPGSAHAPSLFRSYAASASKAAAGELRPAAGGLSGAVAHAARAAGAAGPSHSAARQGMLLATGVLARRGAAAAATASISASSPEGPAALRLCAGLFAGLRSGGPRAVWQSLRLKSTAAAAATAEQAAATAAETAAAAAAAAAQQATRRLYGGAALSEGLSRGARLAVASWLAVCSLWVYSMVVLGGVTRLTRSGLSMTEWKLAGERPPLTEADWVAEFTKYQASPEYQKVHRSMTLEEFKFIYWMEYAHRMWGRFLGLAFALPAAVFLARGWVNGALGRRLTLLFFMGGTQGLVGWWMVRSGLEEPEHEWAAPRVSPYRLAAHLVSAFAIYATLVWTTLDLLYPAPATAGASESLLRSTAAARSRLLPLAALVAVTATSGAFVAGMDAGRAYNTWPLMAGRVVPEEYWDERLALSPLRNLFENTAAVQFNHRTLATTTLLAVGAAWLAYRGGALPARATSCLHAVAAVTAAQFALGVYTLLEYVPVHLGSAHQANALNLFTAALALLHACRPPGPPAPGSLAAAAAPLVTPAAALLVGAVGYGVVTQNGTLTQSASYTGPTNAAAAAAAAGSGGGSGGSK